MIAQENFEEPGTRSSLLTKSELFLLIQNRSVITGIANTSVHLNFFSTYKFTQRLARKTMLLGRYRSLLKQPSIPLKINNFQTPLNKKNFHVHFHISYRFDFTISIRNIASKIHGHGLF